MKVIMFSSLKEIIQYRELIYLLIIRDIKSRYKQSILGIAWAIIRPFSLMVIFTLIFGKLAKLPSEGIPYPIFSYIALLPWTLFTTSITAGTGSIVVNRPLVTKIYLPREVFPIASSLAPFFDFAIAATIFVGMMIFYKIVPTVNVFYILPILLIQIILTLGLVLLLSAINVYFRDIMHGIPLAVQIWMYASPVAYSIDSVPQKFHFLYSINPMVGIIDGYRQVVLHGLPPDFSHLGFSIMFAFGLFIFSYYFFKRIEMTFSDII